MPPKRSGQVLGEEAARRCYGKVLLNVQVLQECIGMMSSQKARENKTDKKREEKGTLQKSSYPWIAARPKR